MVTSNEPGYYADGRFGIRIESLIICNEAPTPSRFGGVRCVRARPSGSMAPVLPLLSLVSCPHVLQQNERERCRYCDFETITMAPIQTKLVEPALLTPSDRAWLNDYHAKAGVCFVCSLTSVCHRSMTHLTDAPSITYWPTTGPRGAGPAAQGGRRGHGLPDAGDGGHINAW